MDRRQTKRWSDVRAELARVASAEQCRQFDLYLEEGRKVSAIRMLREFGISIYGE